MPDAFHSLSLNAAYAMIPLANSTHGMVIETYNLLRSERVPRDFSIIGDTIIKIEHCLVVSGSGGFTISRDETQSHPAPQSRTPVTTTAKEEDILEKIGVVYSHEQALGQCAGWLNRNLPNAKRRPVSSTAAAAMMLLQPHDHHDAASFSPKTESMRAAIAPEICLCLHPDLQLVQKGIQDNKGTSRISK